MKNELCPLMFRLKSGIWPTLGLKLAILAFFFDGLAFLIEAPKVWPHFCQFGKILAEMGSKMFGGIFNQKSGPKMAFFNISCV